MEAQRLYLVVASSVAVAKTGNKYVTVTVKDEKGEVYKVNVWGCSTVIDTPKLVKFVHLKENNGFLSADHADMLIKPLSDKDDKWLSLLPHVPTTEEWFRLCNECCSLVKDDIDKKCITELFKSLYPVYKDRVAARSNHHAHKGGLAQHSFEVVNIFVKMYPSLPWKVDPFAVIVAGLTHDWGKLAEYTSDSELTKTFFLESHPVLGARFIREFLKKFNYSDDYIEYVAHCILAHHMRKEWGSPVEPCTIEAFLVAHLDAISGNGTALASCNDGQQCPSLGVTVYKTKR